MDRDASEESVKKGRNKLLKELEGYYQVVKECETPISLVSDIDLLFKEIVTQHGEATLDEMKNWKEKFTAIAADISPPKPRFEIIRKDGKITVELDIPQWPIPLRCHVIRAKVGYSTSMPQEVEPELPPPPKIYEEFTTSEKSCEFQDISPIQSYEFIVSCVKIDDEMDLRESNTVAKSGMLCKDLGQVFIDDTTKLRPGDEYSVYKGYWKSASPTAIKEVAVKLVHGENFREVDAMFDLSDRNIVSYYASGEVPDDQCMGKMIYIAMELCETKTFWELIKEKELSGSCCICAILHITLGLEAIHENNFLHRDLKPQNILRSRDKHDIKIADFGISKKAKPDASKVTKSSIEIGTDGWGSPEHYDPTKKMSAKSDIYSAGLVFAFALSGGEHVHGTEVHTWKTNIITGKPKPDLSILTCEDPKIAEDVISKMLDREPDERPTASDVRTHPIFWDSLKKLQFLHHMSSFLCSFTVVKQPKPLVGAPQRVVHYMEQRCRLICTKEGKCDWFGKMKETEGVQDNYLFVLKKANGEVPPRGSYDHTSIFDLIRFIRNIEEHYKQHEELIREFDGDKGNIWKLFSACFPTLLCTIRNAVLESWSELESHPDFPKDAVKFFTEPAAYRSLVDSKKRLHDSYSYENKLAKLEFPSDGEEESDEN